MTWQATAEKLIRESLIKVVSIDTTYKTIKYSSKIKCNQELNIIRGEEEVTRAFLINRLVNQFGYKTEKIELEKSYQSGRKNSASKRLDVILYDEEDNPFFFIEVKAPNKFDNDKEEIETQLFSLARQESKKVKYLVYYTINTENSKLQDKAIIIDFEQYNTYERWKDANFPSCGSELTPDYNKPKSQPYVCGEYDLSTDFTKEFISKLTTRLHNFLWTGGGTTDNDIFNSLVNIILAKIQDEYDTQEGQEFKFQIIQYDGIDETDEKIFEKINGLYLKAVEKQLFTVSNLNSRRTDVVNLDKFDMNKLILTVKELQGISLLGGRDQLDGKDLLGDFFEQITRTGFSQNKGQFFTPVNIVKFMLYALQLDELAIDVFNENAASQKLPYIIDPSCGSGTFLIEAMKLVTKEMTEKQTEKVDTTSYGGKKRFNEFFPENARNTWARNYLYGSDFNFDLGISAKVNMILHGDGAANIFIKDGLGDFSTYDRQLAIEDKSDIYGGKKINGKFDVVVTNPPFSIKIDEKTQKGLKDRFLFADKKNSENLFIERYYQLLKEKGRLVAVLPESIFDTTENKYIRLFLFKYFHVKAVVSVPQISFEPYTSTKTSLLFAQKKTITEIEQWNEIWNNYSSEWSKLKTRITRYIDFFVEEKPLNKQWAWVKELGTTEFKALAEAEDKLAIGLIDKQDETQIKENILRFLKNFVVPEDKTLSIKELLVKYADEIINNRFDNDTKDIFGYCNTWWVFGEVAKRFAYPIFMAEVEEVGYKRTKRGLREMPNDLYDVEIAPLYLDKKTIIQEYEILIDDTNKLLKIRKEEFTELEKQQSEKISKANEKLLEQFKIQIDDCKRAIDQWQIDVTKIEVFADKYYTQHKTSSKLLIKAEYFDRTDTDLLKMFQKGGLLGLYISNDVLLRKNEQISLLDKIRKEVIWQ